MKRHRLAATIPAVGVMLLYGAALGCTSEGGIQTKERLVVRVTSVNGTPTPLPAPLPPNLGDVEETWTFSVQALAANGQPDTGFNSFVRVSAEPGAVNRVEGTAARGRNIRLTGGYAEGTAFVTAVFGPARLWVKDMGYEPALPGEVPTCANGIDDDGDVAVDHPNDPGCAFADDMTEEPGKMIAAVSPAVNYALPAVADVQGRSSRTPYESVSMQIATGLPNDVVVTRVSSNGFFITDLADCDQDCSAGPCTWRCLRSPWPDEAQCNANTHCPVACAEEACDDPPCVWRCPVAASGYNHVFAYNYNTPDRMGVCDPVRYLTGTASEFFGFTEISFPSYETEHPQWALENEQWVLHPENCRVPEPVLLAPFVVGDPGEMEKHESGLVRIENFTISEWIGSERPVDDQGRLTNNFGPNTSNCDINLDGVVDYLDPIESSCSDACADEPRCAEWINFSNWGAFKMYQGQNMIRVSTTTAFGFDPLANKGQTITAVTGTLRNFSGGSLNWTIETRCIDDVVCDVDPACQPAVVPVGQACVTLPSQIDNDAATY